MTRTSPRLLVLLGLAAAPVGWTVGGIVDTLAVGLPQVPRLTPVLVGFLAALLAVLALAARGWVAERRYDRRIDALVVARLVVLAKASAVFGALAAGGYGGFAALALRETGLSTGSERPVVAALTALAGVAVAVAACWLERSCTVPPRDDEEAPPLAPST